MRKLIKKSELYVVDGDVYEFEELSGFASINGVFPLVRLQIPWLPSKQWELESVIRLENELQFEFS